MKRAIHETGEEKGDPESMGMEVFVRWYKVTIQCRYRDGGDVIKEKE